MNAGHRFGTITSSLLTCFICTCLASHFRGGYFLWKPTAKSGEIEINYRVSWRRSAGGHWCNAGHIQNRTLIVGEGSLICISGCNGTITNLTYLCTDFSETEDWTTGTWSVQYNITPGVSRLVVGFRSCCWINLLAGGSSWSMTAMADVTLRNATRKINHSPVTSVSPIVRIVEGCNASIDLSVSDNDGDTVQCRWSNRASSEYDECAGICNAFPGAVLNETTCTIYYTPNGTGSGYYGVAVQVEDFPATGGIVPYSSVPLQFLVQIYASTQSCYGVPVFLQPTKLDGEVTYIREGVSHKEEIIARSSVPNARIAEITTVSPRGSVKSQLMQYPNAENAWYVEIRWTPNLDDADQSHVLCFSATDQHGLTSKQRCIILTVTRDIPTKSPVPGDDPVDWFSRGDKTSINVTKTCTLVSSNYEIPIFNSTHKAVYVCANGIVSFDLPFESPGITSTTLSVLRGQTVLAPYLVHIYRSSLNKDASITYRVHNKIENTSESADINEAKIAIKKFYQEFDNFDPQFILIADWTNVTSSNISEKMTFRLVLFTNGANTFVFYIYSDISLRTGSVFIGYSEASGQFHKNYHSFEKTAYSISTTAITYGYRGLLLYRLTYPSADTDTYRQKCLNWYLSERNDRDKYHEGMSKMPLCPCSRQLLGPDQFFANDSFTNFSGILCTYILPNWQFQPKDSGKMCCYDNNGFRSDGPFGFIRYHKDIRTNEHKVYDLDMKEACCNQQTNLCKLYYDVRPLGHCYTSFPSWHTVARGDPHITTLDGRSFTFNGWGEYTLMTLNTSATGIFDLQARTERTERKDGSLSDATIFTAFAAKDGMGVSVHVELNRSKTGIIIYAKSSPHEINFQDYTKAFFDTTKEFSIVTSYLSLKRNGQTHSLSALFSSGISVIISAAVKMLSIEVAIPNTYKGRVQGLMGNFDGDATNDIMYRNGTLLNASSSDRDIFRYGQTWMIDPVQSAFIYPPGKSYKDFTHAEFTPKFIDEVDPVRVQKAKLDCGNDTECIFDYVFTDSKEVAIETKRIGTEATVVAAQIGNEVPHLTGPLVVNIQLNEPFSYTVNGYDGDGDPITYNLTNPPEGVQIIKNGDGSATVTGTITDINQEPFVISITDGLTYGSSNVIYSSVCTGCSNQGKCDFTRARNDSWSSGGFTIALCICDPYWDGQDCEKDLDGCATHPCSPLRTCVDNPVEVHKALKIGYNCSDCPKGYLTMIDGSCEDINECNTTPKVCTQRCIDTVGSFRCDCDSGYRLDPSNKTVCRDINECAEGPRKCDQVCNNSAGNYSCGCFEGYSYNLSTGICEIDIIPPECMTIDCRATNGCRLDQNRNATCFCNVGYELNTNGSNCVDFDECKANICQQKCINSHGSYSCSCFNGYVLDDDNKTCNRCEFPHYGENCNSVCTCDQGDKCDPVKGCVCSDGWTGTNCNEDVDECQKNILICGDPFKNCINTNGSYMCLCNDGFRLGSNGLCQDIQECEDPALNNCTQLCTNENGGFSCGCYNGYISDRKSDTLCKDIDECAQSTANCQHTCLNTNGSFTCTCYPEYDLMADGKSCKLADDHSGRYNNLNCSHIYNFQDGAVSCSCNNGYRLGADNQTCLDIDECANLTSNRCSEKDKCFNIEGGYTCSCSDGYTIGNDGRNCIACNRYHYGPNCRRECNCGVGTEQCDSIIGCVCKVGWTGQQCDVDKDECSYKTCVGQNTICMNTFGSYKCTCKPGFKNETNVCKDTDECIDSRQNDCEQDCLNTIGSYECRCGEGYLQNGTKCQDIDECSGKNDCSYGCENTIGGYRCICGVEFKLNITDQRTCIPETACQRNETAFCLAKNALCTTVKGQSECYCDKGYAFDNNNMTCQDIDECRRSPCDTYCVNKNGTFECSCMEGNKLARDGLTCIACPEGTYGPKCTLSCSCFPNNTVQCDKRSGNCTCNAGFTGVKCESDINECEIGNGGCSNNSKCINTNGSRACICEIGYIKTWGGNCIACDTMHYGEDCVNECACAKTTSRGCNNINGTCTCRDGWQGSNCTEDIDECQRPTNCTKPHTRCKNTHGSYVCLCEEGYRMTDHHQCEDVNECLEGTHNCTQSCDNIPGSFKCICAAGFEGDGSNCTECKSGHWGIGCKNTCSCDMTNSFGCNKETGCLCYSNWTGLNCSEDRDECLDQSICPQHSHCVNSFASFSCECNTGYIRNGSSRCDACSGNRYGNDCQSTCKCTSDNVRDMQQMCDHETGTCICKYGWQGNCSEDRNECAEFPDICTDDPTKQCLNSMGGFECVCFIEKTDGTCLKDNDECKEETPCKNNGTCQNTYGSYICNCSNGWTDENCTTDVDECGTSPCLNDGTCHNTAGSYRCQCSLGWTGIHCSTDINECVNSPCENNGTCTNIMGSYVCDCSSGWTERNCLKACSDNMYGKDCGKLCKCNATNAVNANQTCKATDGTCTCKREWKDDCSQEIEPCLLTSDGCKTTGNADLLVGLGIGISLFFLSLIIIGIAMIVYAKRRKEQANRYLHQDVRQRQGSHQERNQSRHTKEYTTFVWHHDPRNSYDRRDQVAISRQVPLSSDFYQWHGSRLKFQRFGRSFPPESRQTRIPGAGTYNDEFDWY